MRELSLFSGVGGGLLATHHLLGWQTVGYVEFDDYCQRVLAARIRDGLLSDAPIFGDIRAFISDGYADAYSGLVDVVTAGFPCQPFSYAGLRLQEKDPRNLWPETIETIRHVRPHTVFLENTPGIQPYLPVVFGGLRRAGLCVHPRTRVAAATVGAGHRRRRHWFYAHAASQRCQKTWTHSKHSEKRSTGANSIRTDDDCQRLSDSERREAVREITRVASARARNWPTRRLAQFSSSEPDLGRMVYGIPNGVDRLRAIGNAQFPAVAALAWEMLTHEIIHDDLDW